MVKLHELKDGDFAPTKKIKRCAWEKCPTILGKDNPNKYCWAHLHRGTQRDFELSDKKGTYAKPYAVATKKKKKSRQVCRYEDKEDKRKKSKV